MSDVAGTIVIEVTPDFSGFEEQLSQGLKQAADNAQKSTANAFKKSTFELKNAKQSTIELVGANSRLQTTLDSIDGTLRRNASSLNRLNKSVKESTAVAREGSSAFQRLVEVVANLSIVFGAFLQVSDFVATFKDKGGAIAAADDLTARLKLLIGVVAEFGNRLGNNIRDINNTKRAFLDTERAVTKTGRAVGINRKRITDYGKSNKTVTEAVDKFNKSSINAGTAQTFLNSIVNKTKNVFRGLGGQVDKLNLGFIKGTQITGAFRGATEAVGGTLKKLGTQINGINLGFVKGSQVTGAVSRAFQSLGSGLGITINRLKEPKGLLVDIQKAAGVTARRLQAPRDLLADIGRVSLRAGKEVAGAFAGTRVGRFTTAVLLGKKATEGLEGSFRDATRAALRKDGILGVVNVTLRRFSNRTDQASRTLGRFDLISRLSGEAVKGAFKKIITSTDNVVRAFIRMVNAGGGLIGTGTFFSQLGTFATGMTILAGAATAAGGAFVALAQKASSLNESTNATAVTLGDSNEKFRELIGNTQELGVSQNKLNQTLTPLVPILKSAGLEGDNLAKELDALVRRGVDLSSIFNEDVGQSLQSLTAAIRGEIEPARRLGISFNAAEVEAKALSLGLSKVDGQLSESAKQFTRLQLVMEKSEFAAGDFERTSDELANSQRILGAIIDDTVSKISAAFLPAAKAIIGALTNAAKNSDTFTRFFAAMEPIITSIGQLIADLIGVFSAYGGTLGKLVIPLLEILVPLLATVTDLLGSFVAKGLTIALFVKTLESLSFASAALPANIDGVSRSVGSLGGIASKTLRPLLLMGTLFTFFGGQLNGTEASLGALGKAFGALTGVINVFLARALAVRALGPALKGVDTVIKTISFDKFAIGADNIKILTTRLAGLAGGIGIAIGVIAFLDSRTKKITDSVEDLNEELQGLSSTLSELEAQAFAENFEDEIRKTIGIFESLEKGIGTIFSQIAENPINLGAALFGGFGEGIEILEAEKTAEAISQLFAKSPEAAIKAVEILSKSGSVFAIQAEESLKKLQAEAAKAEAALFDAGAALEDLAKTARDELDVATRAFDTLDRVQESIRNTNQEIEALIGRRNQIQNDIVAKAFEEFNAAKAVRDAQRQIEDTAKERANLEERILDIEQQRVNLNKELENIAKTRKEILAEIAELSAPTDEEDLLAAQDAVTVAQINLNKAKREEKKLAEDLLGLNEENHDLQVDLTGLSLDEAKSRIASARASAAAQRQRKKETKTNDDLLTDEEKRELAAINTRDAARDLNDAQETLIDLQQPEITNRETIEDLQETLISLTEREESVRGQIADTLDDEEEIKIRIRRIDEDAPGLVLAKKLAEQDLQKTLGGEIGIQNTIKGINDEIATQRGTLKDLIDQETAALELLEKGEQAVKNALDERILSRLREKGLLSETLIELQKIVAAEARSTILDSLRTIVSSQQALQVFNEERQSVRQGFIRPEDTLEGQIFSPQVIDRITARFLNAGEGADLQAIVRQVLRELNITVPGFSAEGSVIQGSPGPMGQLMHVGEYSKPEAILPLTKPGRFASVLQQSMPYAHPAIRSMIGQMYQNGVLDSVPGLGLTSGQSQSLRSRKPTYAGGSVPFESAKPSKLEQKLDRLIQLQEEANSRDPGINAPITIHSDNKSSDMVARKTVRELERQIRRNR